MGAQRLLDLPDGVVVRGGFDGTERPENEEAGGIATLRQKRQQIGGRIVAPVQVLEYEDDGRAGCPGLEERSDLAQHAFRRCAHHRARGSQPARRRTRARESARTSRVPSAGIAEPAARPPGRSAHARAPPARACRARAVRVAGCTGPAGRGGLGPHRRGAEELFQERCLADTGLARDEDELTLTLAGSADTRGGGAARLPSDEPDTGLEGAGRGRER